MSNTYLDWAKRNFTLNGIRTGNHQFIRGDCLEWLNDQANAKQKPQFDLIFLDPPTFSNSKKVEEAFDIQRDHVQLIHNAAALLSNGRDRDHPGSNGVLYFSTNSRRFRMDTEALTNLSVENISATTIPQDFERDTRIHSCWKITQAVQCSLSKKHANNEIGF